MANGTKPKLTHVEEYKAVRDEILLHIAALSRTHLWAVLGTGGVLTWLSTHKDALVGPWRYAWFIAPVIMLGCALVDLDTLWRITLLAGYLKEMEGLEFSPNSKLCGWEHYRARFRLRNLFGNFLGTFLWLAGIVGCLWFSWSCWEHESSGTTTAPEGEKDKIVISESRILFGDTKSGATIAVVGTLTNFSAFAWKQLTLHADFFDAQGRFVDSGEHQEGDLHLAPNETAHFKISLAREFAATNYFRHRVRVVSATDGRAEH